MKEDEFEIGTKVIFHIHDNSEYVLNGLELEIASKPMKTVRLDGLKRIYAKCLKPRYGFKQGSIICPLLRDLKLKYTPKPHEYSPVLMTGRYKTVGD